MTFVAFEGIDGAGKTTVSRLVHEKIAEQRPDALYFPKSSLHGITGYQAWHMKRLRELIWPKDDGGEHYKLGDEYWLHLVAAWYGIIAQEQVVPYAGDTRIAIFDSWCYRFMAKFTSKGYDQEVVSQMFGHLPRPDVLIWLDVDPGTAWGRRQYKQSEMGRWQEQVSPGRTTYVNYQEGIRRELAKMATAMAWTPIRVDPGVSVDTLAEMVVDEIVRRGY